MFLVDLRLLVVLFLEHGIILQLRNIPGCERLSETAVWFGLLVVMLADLDGLPAPCRQ